jgi:phosphonopyruvate decarboxylase
MVTLPLLESLRYPYFVLGSKPDDNFLQTKEAIRIAKEQKTPVALVVRKGLFEEIPSLRTGSDMEMTREDALEEISNLPGVLVSTTGFTSRELFEIRERRKDGHERDFLTVGSMGHSSMIALGISLAHPEQPVTCIDGDGAFLMHLGAIAILGKRKPNNFTHIVMNNGVHDSVGGQPTDIGALDLIELVSAAGYQKIDSVSTREELHKVLSEKSSDFRFIEVKVRPGARKDLGRPTTTPQENRDALMNFITNNSKQQ